LDPVILIALVNETLRDAYGLLFAEQGYRVLTASRVLECLHKVRWLAPEVLVMDVELWGGEEGLVAISGGDVVWPSVVIINPRGSDWQDEIPLPPVVSCLERPVDFDKLLDEVTEARRIFHCTGGNAALGPAMRTSIGLTSDSKTNL
jgi:DNA-binding NtrC family response regulator